MTELQNRRNANLMKKMTFWYYTWAMGIFSGCNLIFAESGFAWVAELPM